jgi:hypothetical protein
MLAKKNIYTNKTKHNTATKVISFLHQKKEKLIVCLFCRKIISGE